MKTREQLIAECKSANSVMKQIVNDVEVELTNEEYEKACEAWADMRLEQLEKEAEIDANLEAKSILLERLGITAEEAALLLS
jgi:hypothetical protein